MNKKELKKLVKECIIEVLTEDSQIEPYDPETDTVAPGPRDRMEPPVEKPIEPTQVEAKTEEEDPLYVQYHSQRQGENPFEMQGQKFEYVNAIYPNGKKDIGVYAFAGDIVYSYNAFRQMYRLA